MDQSRGSKVPYSSVQVFLSLSVRQRDFAEHLYVDLTRENISCFFDKQSLLEGEEFPLYIFEAAEKCEVAIVVLSEDYITSGRPMRELCALVGAKNATNPDLKIFPLFYKMSPHELSQKINNFKKMGFSESWKSFCNSSKMSIDFDVWLDALKALRSLNGRLYNKEEGKVDYRHKILSDIRRLLQPNIKYADSSIKGKERLCQEVANMFDKAPNYMHGLKVVGLHGPAGYGKTTVCKILSEFYFQKFPGKVFHAEFQEEGLPAETLKRLLMILTDTDEETVKFVCSYEQALSLLRRRIHRQRFFLALDNIRDRAECIQQAQACLRAGFGSEYGSLILLTARSADILGRVIPEDKNGLIMPLPNLNKEEAIEVLLSLTSLKASELTEPDKNIAKESVALCHFIREYHPLFLRTFGACLWDKFTSNLSHRPQINCWRESASRNDARENIFKILELCFRNLPSIDLGIFMLLNFYLPNFEFAENFDYFDAVCKWLANVFSLEDDQSIRTAIDRLKNKGLLLNCESNAISIHSLLVEFGERKLKEKQKWILLKGEDQISILISSIVEAIKFKDCKNISNLPSGQFNNVKIMHIESVPELRTVQLESFWHLRSITIVGCNGVENIRGLENLRHLHYLRVGDCDSLLRCPSVRGLRKLRHLNLQLRLHSRRQRVAFGNMCCAPAVLTLSKFLEEIYLDGVCQVRLPKPSRLRNIRAITLNDCNDVIGPLDLTDCRQLRIINLRNCSTAIGQLRLDLTGCIEVRSICLSDPMTEVVGLDGLTALDDLSLSRMESLQKLRNQTLTCTTRVARKSSLKESKDVPAPSPKKIFL